MQSQTPRTPHPPLPPHPWKQHLGLKERASLSLLDAVAKGTELSSDTVTSAPPWTSHTLDGVLSTSFGVFFSLRF